MLRATILRATMLRATMLRATSYDATNYDATSARANLQCTLTYSRVKRQQELMVNSNVNAVVSCTLLKSSRCFFLIVGQSMYLL